MPLSRITTDSLAANSVTSAAIANGEIVLADLAANSVNTAQIIDGSVTQAKLSPAVDLGINALLFTGT